MSKITDILKERFTISIEIVPPRNGTDIKSVFRDVFRLNGLVDFVSVTKGAGGSLRGGSLPISYFIQDKYEKDVIAHFVCRERTKQEIENDLVDLWDFNIHNILALRGDPPAGSKEPWNGDYKYAYQLVKQISDMNKGRYLPKRDEKYHKGLKTDFCIMVAAHPESPIQEEIVNMKRKQKAGADAAITQMVFSYEEFAQYQKLMKKNGITIPILPGIRPVRSIRQIESLEKFFGLKVDSKLKQGIKNHGQDFAVSYFKDFIDRLKRSCSGIHFFVFNETQFLMKILK